MPATADKVDTIDRIRRVISRKSRLWTERSQWTTHWRDITEQILPRAGKHFVQGQRNRGGRQHYNAIIDNTGTLSLRVLGAGMMAGATSPARMWRRLVASDPDLNKFQPVREWLEDANERMERVFQRSNTYRTLHQLYEELIAFGTSASFLMADFDNVIHHYPMTIGEYAIASNWKGQVDTLYREFELSVAAVAEEFGLENCSDRIKSLYRNGNYDDSVTILHAIEPRRERNPLMRGGRNKAWRSVYVEAIVSSPHGNQGYGQGGPDKFLRESGFDRFPVLVPRWAVRPNDDYGYSPAMDALGDVVQLQHMQHRKGQGVDYQTKPPLQHPDSLANRDREGLPGGIRYPDPGEMMGVGGGSGPNSGIREMWDTRTLRIDWLVQDMQETRGRIERAFFADLFLMLANAGPDTRMTAREVAERHEEKLLMLGPVLERLHNELLEPLVDMTFSRMLEVGALPPPPPDLQGQDLSVEFVSVLAQAQKAIGTNATDRFLTSLGVAAQIQAGDGAGQPEVLDKFDFDEWADGHSDDLGVDPRYIVSDERVAELRQARNQRQAAVEQAAAMREMGGAAKDLAAAQTSQPSALTALTGYSEFDPSQVPR